MSTSHYLYNVNENLVIIHVKFINHLKIELFYSSTNTSRQFRCFITFCHYCIETFKNWQNIMHISKMMMFSSWISTTLYLLGKAWQMLVWDPGRLSWEGRHCLFPFWIYSLQSLGLWIACLKYSTHLTEPAPHTHL